MTHVHSALKALRRFEGINYKPKSISISVNGELYPMAEKLEEYSKWQSMTGHKFTDLTEKIADDILHGKTEDVEQVKPEVDAAVLKGLQAILEKTYQGDLVKAKDLALKLQKAPVAFLVKQGKMDEVDVLTKDLLADWLNAPIAQELLDLSVAQGLMKVFADVKERVTSFTAMIEQMSRLSNMIQEKYQKELTEENFRHFEDNLSTIRSEATLEDLRDHESYKLTGKNLYELHLKKESLDSILTLLKRD